MFFAVGGNV